jgi:hypothetical protein
MVQVYKIPLPKDKLMAMPHRSESNAVRTQYSRDGCRFSLRFDPGFPSRTDPACEN